MKIIDESTIFLLGNNSSSFFYAARMAKNSIQLIHVRFFANQKTSIATRVKKKTFSILHVRICTVQFINITAKNSKRQIETIYRTDSIEFVSIQLRLMNCIYKTILQMDGKIKILKLLSEWIRSQNSGK